MKNKFVFIFTLFIFFRPVLPIMEYVVFYDYIKSELCINKDNSELKCNGKCHLEKEFSKVFDSENTTENEKNNRTLVEFSPLFFQNLQNFSFKKHNQNINKKHWFYHNLYSFLTEISVFHPPL